MNNPKFISIVALFISINLQSQTIGDEGIQEYWSLMDKMEQSEEVSDNDLYWLWTKSGYKSYAEYGTEPSVFFPIYKEVYNPKYKTSYSLEKINRGNFNAFVWNRLNKAKLNRKELKNYVTYLKSPEVIQRARNKALKYLPDEVKDKGDAFRVELILADGGGRVYYPNKVAIIDAFTIYEEGEDIIAHEMHHLYTYNYVSKLKVGYKEQPTLIHMLQQICIEGIADRINMNGVLDKEGKSVFETQFVNNYNQSYQRLERIDEFLAELNKDFSKGAEIGSKISNTLPDAGHSQGYYMATVIESEFGKPELIKTLENPFLFFKTYNRAAQETDGEYYIFSNETIAVLDKLEKNFIK